MYLANFSAILSLAWFLIPSINNLLITVFSFRKYLASFNDSINWSYSVHQNIREKKKYLHKRVFMMGIISAGASAVPFPGVDVVADLAIIAHAIYPLLPIFFVVTVNFHS
jgi:hypothetical protein